MAFPSRTTSARFTGDRNQGLEIGYNSGSIESHFHVPAGKFASPHRSPLHSPSCVSVERPETPPRPSCFVPFRRDPDFIDRAALLDEIDRRCSAPASRVALVGLGGVGKSQLAIEYCYRTAERSPETWVLWAHASNTSRLALSFRQIADHLKVRGRKDPQVDVLKLMHDWLRDEKNGRWLLVIDNADDAGVLSARVGNSLATAEQANDGDSTNCSGVALQQHLREYLPPSQHGSVLVTSRTRRAAMEVVEDDDIVPIEPMEETAAHALLRKKLGDKEGVDDDTALLAAALDYVPLALVQAAAYIRQRAPRCSVQQYLEEYRQSDGRATSLLNREAGYLRRDKTASNAILVTWQISFEHMRSLRRSAANLLSLMSFFDRQGIPEAVLRSKDDTASNDDAASDDDFEEDLDTLRDYSFVTVTRDAHTFEMHSLVQLATRKWLENQEQLDKWRDQFISNLCAEFPAATYENWKTCQALFPHAKAALVQRPTGQRSLQKLATLLYNATRYALEQQDRAGEAEQMSVMSMDINIEMFGEESIEASYSLSMVARARELGGKYEEAEVMYRKVQAIHEKVLEREHPHILMSMDDLARVLSMQGKYEEAEALFREALTSREKMFGREHPETLTSTHHLARVMMRRGQYEETEGLLQQTLAIQQKVLGPEHLSIILTMHNLAGALLNQCRYKEAEGILRQTIDVSEKILGRKHPAMLMSVYILALVLARQRCYGESLALYNRACAGLSVSLGEEHQHTRACYWHRSELLASIDQSQAVPPVAKAQNSATTDSRKTSRLLRGLARLKIRTFKHKEEVT